MLEVGLVVGAGREQCDVRRRAGRAHGLQAFHHGAVGGGQPLHLQRLEGLRELARDGEAVLQQVAQARGRLRALRDHPPVAVRAAGEVEGRDAQPGVARRPNAMHGAQVAGMAAHQGGRQQAFGQQLLRAVDVGQHAVEHARALDHAGLDLRPALWWNDEREEVERPGALRPVAVGVHVVGDAVVADLALQAHGAPRQVGEAGRAERLEELAPRGRQRRLRRGRRRGRLGARFDGWRFERIVQRCDRCDGTRGRCRRGRRDRAAQLVEMAGLCRRGERGREGGRRFQRLRVEERVVQRIHSRAIVTPSSSTAGARGRPRRPRAAAA